MAKKLFFTLSIIAFFASCGTRRTAVQVQDPATFDEGVVINGVRWATRNVDAPGTFVESPESSGMFFQWNRRKGWSEVGELENWDSSMPTGTEWYAENDPCPKGWRVPTADESRSLLLNTRHQWVSNWNNTGINGRIFGTAHNQIFLSAAGVRSGSDGSLDGAGLGGFHWSSTQAGSENAWNLWFSPYGLFVAFVGNYWRTYGFSIRCVAK